MPITRAYVHRRLALKSVKKVHQKLKMSSFKMHVLSDKRSKTKKIFSYRHILTFERMDLTFFKMVSALPAIPHLTKVYTNLDSGHIVT